MRISESFRVVLVGGSEWADSECSEDYENDPFFQELCIDVEEIMASEP